MKNQGTHVYGAWVEYLKNDLKNDLKSSVNSKMEKRPLQKPAHWLTLDQCLRSISVWLKGTRLALASLHKQMWKRWIVSFFPCTFGPICQYRSFGIGTQHIGPSPHPLHYWSPCWSVVKSSQFFNWSYQGVITHRRSNCPWMMFTSPWNLNTSLLLFTIQRPCCIPYWMHWLGLFLCIYFKTHMELNSIMKCWHPYDQNNMS